MGTANLSHKVFAATLIALAAFIAVYGASTPVWGNFPPAGPARSAFAGLRVVLYVGCSLGMLWPRIAIVAVRVLCAYLFLWMLLVKFPIILSQPSVEVSYEEVGETAVLVAAAWTLYCECATDMDRRLIGWLVGSSGTRNARILYGLALIAFGFSHFAYLANTVSLVPSWLPWHDAWAYFTGTAYLVAGAAMVTGIYARLAAALSALQMGVFTVLVWLPQVVTGHADAGQWGEFVVSAAMSASGWVVADSYRRVPWLAFRPSAAGVS